MANCKHTMLKRIDEDHCGMYQCQECYVVIEIIINKIYTKELLIYLMSKLYSEAKLKKLDKLLG